MSGDLWFLRLSSLLLFGHRCDATPLAAADFDQLVEQNLVVLIDAYISLVRYKFFVFQSFDPILSHSLGDLFSFSYCFV